ncbi:MAG: glutamine-hydrolyzing GMP synthase [Phycisphaerae bacterium]|nr:glutamine-hydrolyzing GMP synthase [Phycisphaerae bacterium]
MAPVANPDETIAILDFGSQYAQLIARRVRENHVFSVLCPPEVTAKALGEMGVAGLIFSGGPASVYVDGAPKCDPEILRMGIPILGICYGMQIGCQILGGEVQPTSSREYGRTHLRIAKPERLLAHVPGQTTVWMSHGDIVAELGEEFVPLATTGSCPYAAVRHASTAFYGVQFHPEVTHTPHGGQIIRNFVYDICGCQGTWRVGNFVESTIESVRAQVGPEDRVICALSGGVDSSVVAALLHRALGDRLACIFVNNGVLRKNEAELVEATFRDHFRMNLRVVDAAESFLSKLRGVVDPQRKRVIIGEEFFRVFREEASTIEGAKFLAQGTLYPDVIESGRSVGGQADQIKQHHNLVDPSGLGLELIEPLRDLFKDEVRQVGEALGLPEEIVWRHPFPGPGLAVRVIGEVTPERLDLLRDADEIVIEEIRATGWYRKIAQGFAVLLPVSAVGVMGDGRSYEGNCVIAVRFVETSDFMTADWTRIDHEVLARISNRIINEVKGINRVVYDISSKPPSTIEWE